MLIALGLLAGCATTTEMPLAPNVVRIDTQASGLAFVGSAPAVTMKKAATATIARGYTHFKLDQATTSQGSRVVGMNTYGSGNVTANSFGTTTYGTYSGRSFSTPVRAPTANIGVTVTMFKAGEAGASGAWDAADVIKKGGKV